MIESRWRDVDRVLAELLELPERERSAYLAGSGLNSVTLRRVEELLAALHESKGFLEEPLVGLPPENPDRWIGQRLGAWRLTSVLGSGGMGTVYRAQRDDSQYSQEAAVKLIAAGAMSRSAERRFRAERQILARLEHPCVARLIDGGLTPQGEPFLVMEYVRGVPIDEWCRQQRLDTAGRLRLFRRVCDAVQFLHQNLVVHCDLKPGNILVNEDGVPKLLDFGIARILERPSGATHTLLHPMTPDYASPEQVRGGPIGTASDVYSLGILLYELVSGNRPYRLAGKPLDEVVATICESDVENPRTGATDLDAVILKALRKDPEARYAYAAQLAADLGRYLDARPVEAHQGSWVYRTRKFLSRRRVMVALAAAVVVLSAAGGTAVLGEARLASQQKARAERRFADVRKLANSLLFDVHDAIRDLPGSTPARELLAGKAQAYLDSLAHESGSDVSLKRELAAAYERLAEVQGYQYRSNLGRTAAAMANYRKALELRQELASSDPNNASDEIELAKAHRVVAEMLQVSGQIQEASEQIQTAVGIGEKLEHTHPREVESLEELSFDYQVEADIEGGGLASNLGDPAAAAALDERVVGLEKSIVEAKPGDAGARRRLARAYLRLGDAYLLSGAWAATGRAYQQGLELCQALHAESPNPTNSVDLAMAYSRAGNVQTAAGRLSEAAASYGRQLEIDHAVAAFDPKNTWAHGDLLWAYANLGDVESRMGQNREAMAELEKARAIGADLVAASPGNVEFRSYQATAFTFSGEASARQGDASAASQFVLKGLAIYSELNTQDPTNAEIRLQLADGYNRLGFIYLQRHEPVGADKAFRQALNHALPDRRRDRPKEEALYAVADAYTGLGDVSMALGAAQPLGEKTKYSLEAHSWYQQSLNTWGLVKEPALVTPAGFDCIPRTEVVRRAALCETARKGSRGGATDRRRG